MALPRVVFLVLFSAHQFAREGIGQPARKIDSGAVTAANSLTGLTSTTPLNASNEVMGPDHSFGENQASESALINKVCECRRTKYYTGKWDALVYCGWEVASKYVMIL